MRIRVRKGDLPQGEALSPLGPTYISVRSTSNGRSLVLVSKGQDEEVVLSPSDMVLLGNPEYVDVEQVSPEPLKEVHFVMVTGSQPPQDIKNLLIDKLAGIPVNTGSKVSLEGIVLLTTKAVPDGGFVAPTTRVIVETEGQESGSPRLASIFGSHAKVIRDRIVVPFEADAPLPRGVVFEGPKGSGKTFAAFTLANELDLDFVIVRNTDQLEKIKGRGDRIKRIVVLENLWDYGASPNPNQVLEFFNNNTNALIIATTEDATAIPNRLFGINRFELIVRFTVPDREARRRYLNFLFADLDPDEIESVLDHTEGYTNGSIALLHKVSVSLARVAGRPMNLNDVETAMRIIKPIVEGDKRPNVTFEDIGGLHDVKEKLKRLVIYPFRYPEKFKEVGISFATGILLYGPPGCGKTLLARALANEMGARFLSASGTDFFSKWVGESEEKLRNLFARAKALAPSVIFIDEIDALLPRRGSHEGDSGVSDRLVNQFLALLDGTWDRGDVVVIGATNRKDLLDPAALRPGRLGYHIEVPLPDEEARVEIFKIHLRKRPIEEGVRDRLSDLAYLTEGFSGADIAQVCEEAARTAVVRAIEKGVPPVITYEDLKKAIEEVQGVVLFRVEEPIKKRGRGI